MNAQFVTNTEVTIYNGFKQLIKSGNYEHVILEILNSSKKLFVGQYEHISTQSHGECDFVDIVTGKKYDAKLPFSKKQGQLIGSDKGSYEEWLKTMMRESSEYGDIVTSRGVKKAEDSALYKIIKDRLDAVETDENLILFFPFPIVSVDVPDSIMLQFAGNILTFVFTALDNNGFVKNREVYAIYPCVDNCLAIRRLNDNRCEYVSDNLLKQYIDYNISFGFPKE